MATSTKSRKVAVAAPTLISADALGVLLWRTWYADDAPDAVMNGRTVRNWVRSNAVRFPTLESLAERPQYGNREHRYTVPAMTDPIVRGLAARRNHDLDALSAYLVTTEAPHKRSSTARKVAAGGGSIRTSVRKVPAATDAPTASSES